eukprot:55083_1
MKRRICFLCLGKEKREKNRFKDRSKCTYSTWSTKDRSNVRAKGAYNVSSQSKQRVKRDACWWRVHFYVTHKHDNLYTILSLHSKKRCEGALHIGSFIFLI